MQIIIYKTPSNYLIHNFPPEQLDEIRQVCYDLGIKYYVINYGQTTDKETVNE
jgi:hypothetical protein